ncbi:MAG TPA: heme-binding protein [Candidatus Baltobacteraceae bacterium]|nr:heme-binding protein [Candidatus Baltobacteraceae bacterium]
MDEAFLRRDIIALSCKGAHVVLHAAEKKAAALGVPECIAVVDASGELLAFSRMDGARPGSIEIALTKARSAARRRRPTAEEAGGDALLSLRLGLASQLNVTGIGGGLPIVVGAQVVGAIGVSSGTSDEDVLVGQAGIEALLGS